MNPYKKINLMLLVTLAIIAVCCLLLKFSASPT
jgi:hypothetical protein